MEGAERLKCQQAPPPEIAAQPRAPTARVLYFLRATVGQFVNCARNNAKVVPIVISMSVGTVRND